MMLPNHITSYKFAQSGKSGYLSTDVDAFIQRVHQSFSKLYNDNKALLEKLDEARIIVDEYNKTKCSIADALILAKNTADNKIDEAQAQADKIVAEATEKANRLYDEKKAQADAYYNSKVSAADERVVKAESELLSLKNQAEIFSEKYIEDVNIKARKIIENANLIAASAVADAYEDAEKAKKKADDILNQANSELNILKAEAAKIKNEMLALISLAQKAAEEVDNRIFEPVAAEADDEVIVEVEQFDADSLESFNLDDVKYEPEINEAEEDKNEEVDDEQPGFIRFFDTQLPPVDDIMSGIFASLGEEKAKSAGYEEENSYRFNDIFADPSDISGTRRFNPINDSE